MSHYWSLITIFISIILFQISSIHSTPIVSETTNHIIDDNDDDDYQRAHNMFIYSMKNILDESNPYERTLLLNQLRENLNRMCVAGFFGRSQADTCQRIVNIVHHNNINNDDNSDTSNEPHGIQKRFFCNGFTGCKSPTVG
jgi:hypothetical protein